MPQISDQPRPQIKTSKKQEDELWGKEKPGEKDDREEKKGEEEKEKEEINKSTLKLFKVKLQNTKEV